ncbi:hypothetical protein C5B85_17970 [Pseudoclavibacter sp. AY1F1]|uniref:hypothetical protein n=1 Tax=Pseudoclavibacter sp. AY1F1 TaxID=2080583 RepID=UPI000CE7E255|nr:hypothetical protein [Pseudoclavibacter sp. AY1F1]PPF41983.1 hypothetical protein C5B85_17970 [Pseudoclavibacter sp. AY1F1]
MTSPGLLTPALGEVDLKDAGLHFDQDAGLAPPVDSRPHDAARVRRVRLAFVAASVSTFIALASHVFAGGGLPGMLGIAFPFGLAVLACLLLARIRTDSLRLALSVGASQFLFHTLFVLGTPPAAGGSGTMADAHAGHAAHGQLAASSAMADFASSAGAGSSSAAIHLGHDGPLMWAMHAVAAVLTALALYFGEALLASLAKAKEAAVELLLPLGRVVFVLLARVLRPNVAVDSAPLELPWVPALTVRAERATRRRGPPTIAMPPAFATSN